VRVWVRWATSLARKGRDAVFFVGLASIVNNRLTCESNGRRVLLAGKERVLLLSLEVSQIEVEGATSSIKLAFKASGCLVQQW
jgi:hypothetical protein